MPQTLKIKTRDSYGVTFADPTDPNYSVRFKSTSGKKKIGNINADNYVTEIIYSDLNAVSLNTETANDTLSVRLRISGTGMSMTQLKQIVSDLAAQVDTWASEDVFTGFDPATPPVRNHE